MKPIIFSVYCDNISPDVLQAQREVVNKFRPPEVDFIQARVSVPEEYLQMTRDFNMAFPSSVHSSGLDYCIKCHSESHDVFVILDIDCIPLNHKAIPYLIEKAATDRLVGTANSWVVNNPEGEGKGGLGVRIDNIPLENYGHVYVAPFAMAISSRLHKIINTSFAANDKGDVAEHITKKAEELGIPIDYIWPTDHSKEFYWPLKPGMTTGSQATYEGLFWHLLAARSTKRQKIFVEKCKEILNAVDRI